MGRVETVISALLLSFSTLGERTKTVSCFGENLSHDGMIPQDALRRGVTPVRRNSGGIIRSGYVWVRGLLCWGQTLAWAAF
jgi:hypothetical protein